MQKNNNKKTKNSVLSNTETDTEKTFTPTDNQNLLITRIEGLADESQDAVFMGVNSAPGSGKTSTAIYSIGCVLPKIKRDKKILVLTSETKMKKEFATAIIKSGFDEERIDVMTVHSLFFRHTNKFEKNGTNGKIGAFSLDYTKGFFNKFHIEEVLSSMIYNDSKYSPEIESLISINRILSEKIITPNNLTILKNYTNAYYSSPARLNDTRTLADIAAFFAPNKASKKLTEISISEDDKKAIKNRYGSLLEKGFSHYDILFFALIRQIDILAKTKMTIQVGEVKERIKHIPVEYFENGNRTASGSSSFSSFTQDAERAHIFKVPHNFYYKEFYNLAMQDKGFLREVFTGYHIVIVEEAQDNDRMFFDVLDRALKEGIVSAGVAIGDSDQSIYAFKSPDHFDILAHLEINKRDNKNIGYHIELFRLDETFRFGKEIADFVNRIYTKNSIVGSGTNECGVYSKPVRVDEVAILAESIIKTKKTCAIICRSNSEAIDIALKLASFGVEGVTLNSSIKKDIADFSRNGIAAITDQHVREELLEILNNEGIKSHTASNIMNCKQARDFLAGTVYKQLVKFNPDDISKYLTTSSGKKSRGVLITTAHGCKGAEYDYAVIAGDFFQNLKKNSDTEETYVPPNIYSALGIEDSTAYSRIPNESSSKTTSLIEAIQDPSQKEEASTLYVALTRAKKGVFVLESHLSDELLSFANNSSDANLSLMLARPLPITRAECDADPQQKNTMQPTLF